MKRILDFFDPQLSTVLVVGQNHSGRSTLLANFLFLSNFQKQKLKISNEKENSSNLARDGKLTPGSFLFRSRSATNSASTPLSASSPATFSSSDQQTKQKNELPFEPSCQLFDFSTQFQSQESSQPSSIQSPIYSAFHLSAVDQLLSIPGDGKQSIITKKKIEKAADTLKNSTKTYKKLKSLEMGKISLDVSALLLNKPISVSQFNFHFKSAIGIVLVVDGYDLQNRIRHFISADMLNSHISDYQVISIFQKNVVSFLEYFRQDPVTSKKPVLVLLNKLDLKKAEFMVSVGHLLENQQKLSNNNSSGNKGVIWKFWSDMEIKQALFPEWMDDDRFALVSVSALTGENIMEVFEWFFGCIAENDS